MKFTELKGGRVAPEKVRDYLLSREHPVGRFKAAFFRSLGYAQDQWNILAGDLETHAAEGDVGEGVTGPYGTKYEVRGTLRGPSGAEANVSAVWIVRRGESVPRSVTVYPGGRSWVSHGSILWS